MTFLSKDVYSPRGSSVSPLLRQSMFHHFFTHFQVSKMLSVKAQERTVLNILEDLCIIIYMHSQHGVRINSQCNCHPYISASFVFLRRRSGIH